MKAGKVAKAIFPAFINCVGITSQQKFEFHDVTY